MPMFASLAGNWSSQKKLLGYKYWMASGTFGSLSSSIVDTSGNIYLRSGPVVTKMDAIGTILWSYTYLNFSGGQPGITLDLNQDIIIVHNTTASPYAGGITKISKTDGAVLWTRTTSSAVGTGWYSATAVTTDPTGNIYFICDDGNTAGGMGNSSYMIVKFNNAGTWQWQRKIDIGTTIYSGLLLDIPSVLVANNSYVYFGGMVGNTSAAFYGALTTAGALSWAKTHNGIKITGGALDSSGNVYFGDGYVNTNGILKFNATGTLLWQKKIQTAASGGITGYAYINIDAANGIYYMPDSQKPLIIKYDTSGAIVWQRLITSTAKTFTQAINIGTFPTASESIFVAAGSSGGITSYGVIPSTGTTYASGEWAITTPANLNVDYGKTITVRTPIVTAITPVIVATAMTKSLYTPSGIVITPLA